MEFSQKKIFQKNWKNQKKIEKKFFFVFSFSNFICEQIPILRFKIECFFIELWHDTLKVILIIWENQYYQLLGYEYHYILMVMLN